MPFQKKYSNTFDGRLVHLHHSVEQLQFAPIPLKHRHTLGDAPACLLPGTD